MARGDAREAASLLELAALRGRDATILLRLATVRRALGDLSGAIQAAAAAVELEPRNFLMCMLLGSLREATGAPYAAQRAYRAACANAPLDLSFQPAIARQLSRAQLWVDASEQWRDRLLHWTDEDGQLEPRERRRMRGFRANLLDGFDAGAHAGPSLVIPGVQPQTYFDPAHFAGIQEIERSTAAIRDEFLALTRDKRELKSRIVGLHGTDEQGARPGNWSMIPLIRDGIIVEEFARSCPVTMKLARRLDMPRLSMISPSLYFSVLEPGSRIPPHTGLTNARVIAHVPLIVPPGCGFRVGGEMREWREGEALVFDDMTVHEAWNDSSGIRAVLIADLWHPDLSPAERRAVEELLSCPPVGAG